MISVHERLGVRLANCLGSGPGRMCLVVQEARLAEAVRLGDARSSLRPPLVWAAASLVLALVVVGLLIRPTAEGPTASTNSSPTLTPPKTGTLLQTTSRSETVALADGSALSLAAHTRANLLEIDRENTTVSLTGGRIELNVKPKKRGEFRVDAGRYRVRVVGTRFSVAYAATEERIRVEVTQGRVRVEGPDLPAGGLLVNAGAHYVGQAGSAPNSKHTAVAPRRIAEAASRSGQPVHSLPAPSADKLHAEAPDWRELAERGEYRRAVELAESQGFDALVQSLGDPALLQLANAARFSNHNQRAKQAFLGVRARFPKSPSAVLSGYYLARLALDVEHNRAQAVAWLETYLREAPRGQLSAGARLDLMKLFLESGETARARSIAADYLKHHPNGDRADFARSLLKRTRSGP